MEAGEMKKCSILLVSGGIFAWSAFTMPVLAADIDPGTCFDCHEEVQKLHQGSKHMDLGCAACHSETAAHVDDPEKAKPVTSLELSTCGECHPDQYDSFYRMNWEGEARKEKGMPTGRSPQQDKLLAPHGFTKEHNEPRAHPFMVIDQFVVDRFAGGRYQFKDLFGYTRTGKVWDVLEDTGRTLPQTAAAGNPVCLQCKTSDLILKWKYMGDKDDRAMWDRTSDTNELIRDVQNPLGCIHCHDPHATRFRVVRDALIEAVERDGARPYDADPARNMIEVVNFRDFRKIGLLEKPSTLLCGQCHVEYNCNPGIDTGTNEKFTMADPRSNHFPMKNAKDILAHYDQLKFRDFKHAVTGAGLIKLQHPEMETYWGSVHDKAGVQCYDCHMPKEKNGAGETYTSHQVVRPKHHVAESCLGCHEDSTVEEKLYQIQAVQNYTRGKMRKAEDALALLIDTYAAAARKGVAEEVLTQARRQHEIAHVLWEWWTAENSDGWHNPELARETLVACIDEANKGTQVLKDAMK
jgi:formate-dependent nitrite reductase cytochrome c552 subunit